MAPGVAEADAPATATERYDRVPLDQIIASKTNPRTHFDDGYLDELARSIADKGLIQPIVVRPLDGLRAIMTSPEKAAANKALFEIVAGECRWRAAKRAGLIAVPTIIRVYSDEQVLELQLVENLHRTDLTPLEQAAGYRRLIDSNPTKHSAESIASRIGMSPGYVWDRLKLNDLIPEAKQLLEQERISVGHAIPIARLKPEDQKRVIAPGKSAGYGRVNDPGGLWQHEGKGLDFDEPEAKELKADPYAGLKPRSVRELEHWIADHIRFDVKHAAQAAPLQFEEVAGRVDQASAKPGRGKKVIAVTFDSYLQPEARDEGERTYGPRSFKFADGHTHTDTYPPRTYVAQKCEHSVLGVVAAGDRRGQAFDVCIAREKCETHWAKEMKDREENRKLRESGQSKKAAANEKRQEDHWAQQRRKEEEQRKAWDALKPKALTAFAEHVKGQKLTPALLREYLEPWKVKEIEKVIGKLTNANLGQAVAVACIDTWTRDSFLQSVKPFKFNLGVVEQAAKKPAAKKAGKKR